MRAIETLDETVAALSTAILLLSAASTAAVLHLRFRSFRSRRRNRLLGLNSLWPVRLLLVLFASLWALAELLRLPLLRPLLPLPLPLRYDPTPLCLAHVFAAHALAEPCFFATVLFLLRATNQPKSSSSALAAALAAALATAIPFFTLHALFLYLPTDFLRRVGIPVDLLGPPSFAYRVRLSAVATEPRCTYPLFGAVLLAALGAVYVPLFVSACWGAVSVVINKRLRVRLYALAAVVVAALCVQVATLALSALWDPGKMTSEGLKLASFVAVSCCAAAGEVILVVQPVLEALAIVDPDPPGTEGKDDVIGIDAAGFGDG
ncbi:uncharacterized protein [Elaeis guineensis]|uniref:uncharacterized protein n=1 Tax=Elaeis guineensis var. tenera TaxID=51953 RepID=UPI003C6CCE7E